MTDEQRKKLRAINEETAPIFEALDSIDEQIQRWEGFINNAQCRRAELQAKLVEWETKHAEIWQEIFDSQEVK